MTMKVRYTVVEGEVIAEKRSGVRKQYVPDPLGSTRALLDNTQTQTDTFTYWPYGEVASRTGTTATPFQFVGTAGYRQDSPSKTYVRARYLDTPKGRWITEDPIGFNGGDWHLYRYTANNPSSYADPSGNSPVCCTVTCYLNHLGKNPICNNRNAPFIGRGCGVDAKEAYQLANDQADDAIRRWNAKRGSNCQFKHCHEMGCTPDRGQRGRRTARGGVPAPIRWFASCSDAQLIGLCIITAAGIVICADGIIVVVGGGAKIPILIAQ